MTRTYHTLTAPEPIPMKQLHWFVQFGHAEIPVSWSKPISEKKPISQGAYPKAARKVVLTESEDATLRAEILRMIRLGYGRNKIYLGLIERKILPYRNDLPMSFKHVCRLIWAVKQKTNVIDESKTKKMIKAFDAGEKNVKVLAATFDLNDSSVRNALRKYGRTKGAMTK